MNAPHKSHKARLIKLADKLYNLRDLTKSTPDEWSEQRVQEYYEWAAKVCNTCTCMCGMEWTKSPGILWMGWKSMYMYVSVDDYSDFLSLPDMDVFKYFRMYMYWSTLLMLVCVGGTECFCNCLSVHIPANLLTLALWKYYQQTSNHTRIKSNNRVLPKSFWFKVMTIFVTHGRRFTTFTSQLVLWSAIRLKNSTVYCCLKYHNMI